MRINPKARSPIDPTPNTPESDTGQIRSSEQNHTPTYTPNFLDIIDGASDCVDFQILCDQIAHGEQPVGKKMSEKKCRFCS